MSIDRRTGKKDVHTHTYILRNIMQPQKRDETVPFATTRMNLEGIMLNEIKSD